VPTCCRQAHSSQDASAPNTSLTDNSVSQSDRSAPWSLNGGTARGVDESTTAAAPLAKDPPQRLRESFRTAAGGNGDADAAVDKVLPAERRSSDESSIPAVSEQKDVAAKACSCLLANYMSVFILLKLRFPALLWGGSFRVVSDSNAAVGKGWPAVRCSSVQNSSVGG
jgi:hypothetical protein